MRGREGALKRLPSLIEKESAFTLGGSSTVSIPNDKPYGIVNAFPSSGHDNSGAGYVLVWDDKEGNHYTQAKNADSVNEQLVYDSALSNPYDAPAAPKETAAMQQATQSSTVKMDLTPDEARLINLFRALAPAKKAALLQKLQSK